MADVLIQFDAPIGGRDGRTYFARACGRLRDDALWSGWVEFVPTDGTAALESPRETTQPNRDDLLYWATGLTHVYLEGALERALTADQPLTTDPAFAADEPLEPDARRPATRARHAPTADRIPPRPVLNPFAVYAQGEDVLRNELAALDVDHLRTLVEGYALLDTDSTAIRALGKRELVEDIVESVRAAVARTTPAQSEIEPRESRY